MSSAMTPTDTPMTEISEISEMKACFRLASRYLSAMKSSKELLMISPFSAASAETG
jgi:hypothetical protein